MTIRIILADDHTVMREGLRVQIEQLPDMEVVAEADNGHKAVKLTRELKPDVVIMDISMRGLNGIEATRQIMSECSGVKVIALSMHPARRYVTQMLKAGASGYILKESAFKEIAEAIRGVVAGHAYLSPKIAGFVVEGFLRAHSKKEEIDLSFLTPKEREVLQLLVESKSTKEIAELLSLSGRTVETHRRSIMDKLGIRGKAKIDMKNGRDLEKLLDYELKRSARHRRFASIVMLSANGNSEKLDKILKDIVRNSDPVFLLVNAIAVLMGETDVAGALKAVDRYRELTSTAIDVRFSVSAFPNDGKGPNEIMDTAHRRLSMANEADSGTVVSRG